MAVLAERLAEKLDRWESAPGRHGADLLHRHGVAAPRPVPARRNAAPRRRPGTLTVAGQPAPHVTACRRVFIRRRIAALVLGTLLVTAVVTGLSLLGSAVGEPAVPDRTAVVEVAPGETLWELAERVAPGSPTQQVVDRIRELNDMRGITIHPGQPLIVPDSGALHDHH